MRGFLDLFENGTIAKQYYVRRCNERTSCTNRKNKFWMPSWKCLYTVLCIFYCTMYFPKTELHFLAEVPLINDQNTKTFFAAIFIRMTSQIQS